MEAQEQKLSNFLDSNRLNRALITNTFDEFDEQEMQQMVIIDLEKNQAAICEHPVNVLNENQLETPVQVITLAELSDYIASQVIQGYDSQRVRRSISKATLRRKLSEVNIYTFIARRKTSDNKLSVLMFNFIALDEASNLILLSRKEITSMLEYDILTGGRNRVGFFHLMHDKLEAFKPGDEYSVIFFNIQTFHHINVLYGMAAGDAVLQHFYTTLGYSNLSPIAYSRVETDHFYALVPRKNVTKENLLELNRLEATFNGKTIAYHCLCGIYHPKSLKEAPSSMCAKACVAANFVKDKFNEPWKEFDEDMQKRYISDSEVVDRLEQALANKEFVPYYQPIVNTRTGRIEMAEALARWISPEFGFVSPGYFIPSLEKHGGISRVDSNIANQVFDLQRKRLRDNKHIVPIDINISWVDFGDPDFVNDLVKRLNDPEVSTDLCRYEITESTLAEITESNSKLFDIFTKNNAKLLIDDFGQGYSFSTMRDVDFYIAKLDKSLIDKLGTSQKADLLVDTLVGMFHKMGAKVVAEGVEKLQQVEYLRRVGCDYIQGFYYYRPMPEDQFIKLLDKEAAMEQVVEDKISEQVWIERDVLEAQYAQLKKGYEESECLKMLLDNQHIYIFEWDVKTHIDVCPDSFVKLYNLPSNEVPNIPETAPICYLEDIERFRNLYKRAASGEHIGSDYIRFIKPDGKGYVWYHKMFHTIFDQDNKPYKVILAMQECTDKYRYQALKERDGLLVRQQDIITFSYTVDDDDFEFSYLSPNGTVETVTLHNYLATAKADDATRDHKYLSSKIRKILEDVDNRTGYIDFWDDRFDVELRAHYSKVDSEYGSLYAIVGQAENINRTREKLHETIKSQEALISMTQGLSKIYNAVRNVDLTDGSSNGLLLDTSYSHELNSGMDWETISQKYVSTFLKPAYRDAFLKFMDFDTLKERLRDNLYLSLEYEDNIIGWVRGYIMPSGYDKDGNVTNALFASMPISSEKEAINRLLYLSETDYLTGIRNRYSGEALVEQALKEHHAGVFAIIDCDNFKQVNDTFGHVVGDKYLIAIASCLRDANPDGIVMRLGGDEFAIYLYGKYDKSAVESFFSQLFSKVETAEIEGMHDFPVSISVGAVCYHCEDNVDFDSIYKDADGLLYKSKKTKGCKLTI